MKKVLHNVARSVTQASRAHMAAVTARLAERGYQDFPFASAVLLWLLDEGGTRSTVLAVRAGVSKQAMSQQVRQMEREGYLEQVPDPMDTRAKVVRMTERGERVMIACVEVREELNREVTAALGKSEAAQLGAYLDAVAEVFGRLRG
jgi:DNA-binding MarR family transcriptional regulator